MGQGVAGGWRRGLLSHPTLACRQPHAPCKSPCCWVTRARCLSSHSLTYLIWTSSSQNNFPDLSILLDSGFPYMIFQPTLPSDLLQKHKLWSPLTFSFISRAGIAVLIMVWFPCEDSMHIWNGRAISPWSYCTQGCLPVDLSTTCTKPQQLHGPVFYSLHLKIL